MNNSAENSVAKYTIYRSSIHVFVTQVPNPSKLRVDLRFFAELVAVGVFVQKEGLGVLANQLTLLVNNDREDHANLSIIVSFCRHCGDDYAGILPRKFRVLAEKYELSVPTSQVCNYRFFRQSKTLWNLKDILLKQKG